MRLSWLVLGVALAAGLVSGDEPSLAEKLKKVRVERYAAAPGYSEGPTWRDGEVFFCSGVRMAAAFSISFCRVLCICRSAADESFFFSIPCGAGLTSVSSCSAIWRMFSLSSLRPV